MRFVFSHWPSSADSSARSFYNIIIILRHWFRFWQYSSLMNSLALSPFWYSLVPSFFAVVEVRYFEDRMLTAGIMSGCRGRKGMRCKWRLYSAHAVLISQKSRSSLLHAVLPILAHLSSTDTRYPSYVGPYIPNGLSILLSSTFLYRLFVGLLVYRARTSFDQAFAAHTRWRIPESSCRMPIGEYKSLEEINGQR